MATKRVLAIHDICSFGRCSLTAAIPVISAMGIQVCPFPTALFSNNLTYGTFTFSDFTPHMNEFMDMWQSLGYSYDAVYSGFLADAAQIAVVQDAIRRFAKPDTLVIVDPAMADDGKLYPVFKPDIITEMGKLIGNATVITPNYTEACLLLNHPYADRIPSTKDMTELCRRLIDQGPEKVVITSVPAPNEEIKIVSYDKQTASFDEYAVQRLPFNTCGTGDLFSSVLTGALLNGSNLHAAVRKAADFLSYAITYTYHSGSDCREGVQVEPCLKKLMEIQ
ncbi:pyridoxine kinase [Megasphaera cerevisiae DSM 20462]|uniref:pyridoxal kinase n=1 Tax=Megasphaera cerevisiae DSM 20462 TaxID=1122219 RepID=A0A0J6ZRJ3_9FIRM|nr:pyridoxamine kinase [Megasphaera cerevisiae]KMO87566.1 pyridoxine kinase [Megasphaera cerevisiae DSM 20462]OKY54317.1 pyridoxine kinase [Megasphaera cerevisiae]SJZ54048.1 pyridoxine kinase [Megasphaera cerevisiae DSM 20462]